MVLLCTHFIITLTSYTTVFLTVLCMNSPKGRNTALATCSPHLIVVNIFYSPVIFTCMTPGGPGACVYLLVLWSGPWASQSWYPSTAALAAGMMRGRSCLTFVLLNVAITSAVMQHALPWTEY
ncbi:hypothetical protein CB1_002015001 [Camelus ferus]|nr:hypothetical protein CB1_002015001 [Camelus ferus]